jgi:hypothetical protein
VSKAAAAEVHADPQRARLVGENVDIVIATPDGPELRARLVDERLALVRRRGVPRFIVEELVIDRRIIGAILPPDTEADRVGDLIGDGRERATLRGVGSTEVGEREIGANRGVAAGNVEADADHGHLVAVCSDAPDRHDVAHVAVRHERDTLGGLRHFLELDDRLFVVLSEDLH